VKQTIKNKILLIALFILSGCGLWSNFTAYFNTYYNASRAFENAMLEVNKKPRELFAFKEPGISQLAQRNFEKVIKKCSAILQFHKNSGYFDDALMMLGKAFYFKGQYSKALRKFKELSSVKKSDLLMEDKLWMGKTELQLRDFTVGMKLLEEVIDSAITEGEEELASEGLISQIRYLLYSDNQDAAIVKINQLLKISKDNYLKAKVFYQLGKIYLQMEDNDLAEKAFKNVIKYEPDYKTEFYSLLELARLQKKAGKNKEALKQLKELLNENKFREFLGEIETEMASINYSLGNIEKAINYYIDVDSTYANKEAGGIADFNIAKIYAKDYHAFDSAMVYYEKTIKNRQVNSDVKRQAMTEYRALKKYSDLRSKLIGQTKQLNYILKPETFERDSLIYADYLRRLDSLKKATTSKPIRGRRAFRSSSIITKAKSKPRIKKVPRPVRPKISADSLRALISDTEFQLGNLLFGEMNALDSAYYYYNLSLKHKPNTLNKPKILYAMGNYFLTMGDSARANNYFRTIYNKYKYDRIVNEAARKLNLPEIDFKTDPAENVYVEAEKKYLDSNYTNAIREFLTIPRKYPSSPYAPKAYYTSGFILENYLNKPDSAASLYDSLTFRYRTSKYARAVFPEILFYKRMKKARQDSLMKAKNAKVKTTAGKKDSVKNKTVKSKPHAPFAGLEGKNKFKSKQKVKTISKYKLSNKKETKVLNNRKKDSTKNFRKRPANKKPLKKF